MDAVGWAEAWMPNVVIGALTVGGLTTTVIERVIRDEDEERRRPHRDDVLQSVGETFNTLLTSIALDYASNLGPRVGDVPRH